MKLSRLLNERVVILPLEAADKWDAIRLLAERAVEAGAIAAERLDSVHQALVTRERSMTTGMEDGVAIPHAAVDGLDDVVAILGLTPEGLDFESVDGAPSRILVCLVIPREKKILHIKTLAEIAKLLKHSDVRQSLIECEHPEAVLEVVREGEERVAH